MEKASRRNGNGNRNEQAATKTSTPDFIEQT
jgi:hypothetical protein